MNTARPNEIVSVKSLLQRQDYQARFREILGARAAQFSASVVNIARDDKVADCEPASVIAAAIVAATLDLPVDRNLGFAWIVPYKRVATFQMGYKGYIQLALRSAQYAGMNAAAVNREVYNGRDAMGRPVLDWKLLDESKPVAGYAFAYCLINSPNTPWVFYWSKEKVQAHAERYSQSYRSGNESPWLTNPDQMGLKTVIKNELSDWGILSVEMRTAMRHDQGGQIDIESEVVYLDNKADVKAPADAGPAGTGAAAPAKAKRAPKPGPAATPTEPPPTEPPPPDPERAATDAAADAEVAAPNRSAPPPSDPLDPAAQAVAAEVAKAKAGAHSPDEAAQALAKVRELMKASGVSEELFVRYATAGKILSKGQTRIEHLSAGKLIQIASVWPRILSEILKLKEAK